MNFTIWWQWVLTENSFEYSVFFLLNLIFQSIAICNVFLKDLKFITKDAWQGIGNNQFSHFQRYQTFTYMLIWLLDEGLINVILHCCDNTIFTHPAYCCYSTMIFGADTKTAIVVITVKAVKVMRQNRSITIAANFQSLIISNSSSCIFIRLVINLSSFKIHCSSRLAVTPLKNKG